MRFPTFPVVDLLTLRLLLLVVDFLVGWLFRLIPRSPLVTFPLPICYCLPFIWPLFGC